jgi:GDPmannose 4,6-dehydratase
VREIIVKTASELGLTLSFEGEGVNEVAKVAKIEGSNAPALKVGQVVVRIDPRYFRPTEVETLLGDPSKAKKELGWVPEITLDEMVQEMVAHDLSKAKQHALLKQHGYDVAVGRES